MRMLILFFAAWFAATPAYAQCGNTIVDALENCDDGNTISGDGCSDSCQFELGFDEQCAVSSVNLSVNSTVVLNTYIPPATLTTSVSAGATTIPVDTLSIRGDATPIAFGDKLIVIQIQGAEIDPGNSANTNDPYGDGAGGNDRSGYLNTAELNAGTYEIVTAAGAISGGQLPIIGEGAGKRPAEQLRERQRADGDRRSEGLPGRADRPGRKPDAAGRWCDHG